MYVRDARNRDEAWLLEHIEGMGLDETAFRSRDYVIAVDEDTNTRAGFGRSRVHKTEADEELCELTSIGVLEGWRGEGVGAHVVERLLDKASDQGFETVYALTSTHGYLAQFGFEPMEPDDLPPKLQDRLAAKREELDPEAIPMRIDADAFEMPDDLRERFKTAGEPRPEEEDPEETAEDFGIDPDEATYKYDTGR